jgi:hypothetical protein
MNGTAARHEAVKILAELRDRIIDVIKPFAHHSPDHPALVQGDVTSAYAELAAAVADTALIRGSRRFCPAVARIGCDAVRPDGPRNAFTGALQAPVRDHCTGSAVGRLDRENPQAPIGRRGAIGQSGGYRRLTWKTEMPRWP